MLAHFVVKDLDSGKSFNVSNVPTFLEEAQLNTFGNTAYKYQDIVLTIVESVHESYTSYEINVYNKKTEDSWVISRRYNEFVALQARLTATGVSVPENLPPKTFFMSQEKVVQTRRQTLERWLNLVVATIDPMNAYLSVFLEVFHQGEVVAGASLGRLGGNFFCRAIDSTASGERPPPPEEGEPVEKAIVDYKGKKVTVNRLSIAQVTLGQAAKK